ncbi:lysophospholipid transporter LplT [Pseudoduganella sp. RAF53_2]|uniref:lysophospholipid transporter LplT n=1 Tax=unclassified Pseudoduganella TaxID=2637179 RepID=UPI003F9D6113
MKRGFYVIMAAQFFSSLADNAMFIACIAFLTALNAPDWMTPMLQLSFVLSYVLLAAFVGAFADAFPKGKVMFVTNLVKIIGCATMFAHAHPLLAYGIVGLGAAAYSPAKYGILTELLPAEQLVAANGWIEGLTIASTIFGVVLGGLLSANPHVAALLMSIDVPGVTFFDSPAEAGLAVIMGIYVLAALFNLKIADTKARYAKQAMNFRALVASFTHACSVLWRDRLGQITLAVTTLFWGAGMVLKIIVLRWGEEALGLTLDKAATLQGVFAIGVAGGAVMAARWVSLKRSLSVMWVGALMGATVTLMTLVHSLWMAYPLLVFIGALAGFFVVPMNALLQHRGHVLMSAGNSIAVQNFNENVSILASLLLYAAMLKMDVGLNTTIVVFGMLVAGSMLAIIGRYFATGAPQVH